MYRIKEKQNGYFTIYEITAKRNFWGKEKQVEKPMYINYIHNDTWYINEVFKSEKECLDFLKLFKSSYNRELVDKIIEI